MRLLVCGGRDFSDWRLLQRVLEDFHAKQPITLLIAGGATGADDLAVRWAHYRKLPACVFPANWKHLGKAAGPTRNKWMLDFGKPDVVIAFPGGRGTDVMVQLAQEAGVKVLSV
ncbi:DUF2493 domain-containing protein [uncultured Brevundimonas sp.]|uniref:DUF2493 domain-containing protein n=1 Tax=uncultured Brevundimonas sp. TaxID=213418 RepID=UPI003436C750